MFQLHLEGTWGPSVKVDGDGIVVEEGERAVRVSYSSFKTPDEVRQSVQR